MATVRFVDADALKRALPFPVAIDALQEAFAAAAPTDSTLRSFLSVGSGELIVMPAVDQASAGVKLLTLNPPNREVGAPIIQGVFVLFGGETLAPVAVIDGTALTEVRTASVSALATRLLARPDASRLVVFGAGVQARAHLEAMLCVRPIEDVVVVDPDPGRAEDLVEAARSKGVGAAVGDADAVRTADLVCTCTTSAHPVFDGNLLKAGAHVNAVGSYRPATAEIDAALVGRAWIAVETREAALAEAGDLLMPIAEGVIDGDSSLTELADLAGGRASRPQSADVTLFKSVGIAFEDLAVAAAGVAHLDD